MPLLTKKHYHGFALAGPVSALPDKGMIILKPFPVVCLFQVTVLLLFLLLCVSPVKASCIIPGTTSTCSELVGDLPWRFDVAADKGETVRITYVSPDGTNQKGVRLKMWLEVSKYESPETAARKFSLISKKAHPDMGLSYAWDFVVAKGERIYHLHADCTLAEQHFNSMSQALKGIIHPAGKPAPSGLFCRCGGGCRMFDQ